MSYFPNQIMPKSLMKETSKEVDDSPAIANAKDWNTIHREIRSIEQYLIGTGDPNSLVFGGKSQSGTIQYPKSLSEAVSYVRYLLDELFNGCLMSEFSGTVRYKNFIKLPDCLVRTKTVGDILSSDTTITVESTAGFPLSGTITKINGLRTGVYCQSGSSSSPVGPGDVCAVGTKYIGYKDFGADKHRTNQEIITYTSKNDNQFLGCTRSINNSTAEDLVGEEAIIICGNASLDVSHNFWAEKKDSTPHACEVYLSVTPDLYVDGGVLKRGTNQVINPIEEFIEASYSLTVISDFQDISMDQISGRKSPNRPIAISQPPFFPETPPITLQPGFLRLDLMNFHIFGWHFYFEHYGLAVLPLSWINGTSKNVSYRITDSVASRQPWLSGSNIIPLINVNINPDYAIFENRNKSLDWTVACTNSQPYCGVYNSMQLDFRNYRTYGSLVVADIKFTVSTTFFTNPGFNVYTQFLAPLIKSPYLSAELSITENTAPQYQTISAKSGFNFSPLPYAYYYAHRGGGTDIAIKSNSVSYIVPNNSVSGWENYFNL